MQYPPYIPAPDSLFASWLLNFYTKINASPTTYGLIAGDATAIGVVNSDFQAKYLVTTIPATRTSSTIAAKDTSRANAEALVRPYAVRIIRNAAVTNASRVDVGVTVPKIVPTPIPAPTTAPTLILSSAIPLAHNLQYRDATDPLVKAKPFGVLSCEIYAQVGVSAGIDPDAATYINGFNKTPLQISWDAGDRGKHATYWARWVTRSGPAGVPQRGPWSDPLDCIIM